MSSFWRKLFCLHCWIKGSMTDVMYGKGYEHEYACHKCGKKVRKYREPISYIGECLPTEQPHTKIGEGLL